MTRDEVLALISVALLADAAGDQETRHAALSRMGIALSEAVNFGNFSPKTRELAAQAMLAYVESREGKADVD